MTSIFRTSGEYLGFFEKGWFFDASGRYLGWREPDGSVWARDGRPLGEIVDETYVLRRLNVSPRVRRTPRVPPPPPEPPAPPATRLPQPPRPGWADATDDIALTPRRADLIGDWKSGEGSLLLADDGRFAWSAPGQPTRIGDWEYRNNLIIRPDPVEGEAAAVVYSIIEYTRDALVLRWLTIEETSLPITLQRAAPVQGRRRSEESGPRA